MYYQQYGKKYKNISSFYDGYWYQSKREAEHAHTLDLLKKAKNEKDRVAEWKRQVKYSLDVNGYHIANYIVDFEVDYADGHKELHEVKGMELDVWKMKMKLLEATFLHENPNIIYRVIK
jgi:hypothetical protein